MTVMAPRMWQKGGLISLALLPLSWIYNVAFLLKKSMAKPFRPRAKVICIGNATVGGAGKTPTAIAISKLLEGKKFCFLSRGYKGKVDGPVIVSEHHVDEVGDEPLILAKHGDVIVSKDRVEGLKHADRMGYDTVIMDDGLQNFSVYKDISILVIDASYMFGNSRTLPAGPLREPVSSALKRVKATILIGDGNFKCDNLIKAEYMPLENDIKGKEIIAFAGIGNPQKFFDMLKKMGAKIIEEIPFPDHHLFSNDEIENLTSKNRNGYILVTTEKDFVRIPKQYHERIKPIKVKLKIENLDKLKEIIE